VPAIKNSMTTLVILNEGFQFFSLLVGNCCCIAKMKQLSSHFGTPYHNIYMHWNFFCQITITLLRPTCKQMRLKCPKTIEWSEMFNIIYLHLAFSGCCRVMIILSKPVSIWFQQTKCTQPATTTKRENFKVNMAESF
jgi:hypothetical protein